MPLGPGGLDSNGIWLYGEDDSEALASDLLNLGMQSVSDVVAGLGGSGILQVVSTTKTDTFSTTSSTLTDVTGLSATITPSSSSSKVLVLVSLTHSNATAGAGVDIFTLTNSSNTNLLPASSPGSRIPGFAANFVMNNAEVEQIGFTLLHSPSTTSAYTYKVRCQSQSSTLYVNRGGYDLNDAVQMRGVSTITLMEVAG